MPGHDEILAFLLLLALVLAAARSTAWLSLRLGQPAVLGELLAGVVLGPSVLDLLHRAPFAGEGVSASVFLLANIGVVLLMFIAGLVTVLPFGFDLQKSAFMGIVLTATSVSITVQTLIELRQLNSKEGTTLLGAAVVDDVVALLVLAVFVAVSLAGGSGLADVGVVLMRMAAFFIGAILLGRLFRPSLSRAKRAPVSEGLLAATLIAVLAYAWSAEALGGVAAI